MNFNFIASFVAALAIFSLLIRRSGKNEKNEIKKYWEKELLSNSVRRKNIDCLDYITIPDDILDMTPAKKSSEMEYCLQTLRDLSKEKIVNLTGISNTDLKLTYGTANITLLSEYDFHYTNMVTTLQKLAECLVEEGETELAVKVLEFSISTRSDVSKSYYLLSSLYRERGEDKKIDYLIQAAENINSIMKDSIVRNLKASGQ